MNRMSVSLNQHQILHWFITTFTVGLENPFNQQKTTDKINITSLEQGVQIPFNLDSITMTKNTFSIDNFKS